MKRCSRCLYDETVTGIEFDESGVCNYCHTHDRMEEQYPTGEVGFKNLQKIAEEIKLKGRKQKYDVIVGVSGGTDSSYTLHLAKELGLRPLAVHFDNTWNSTVAVENIQNVLQSLDVDLYTYVVDNKEYDDLYRSFLKAGVIDTEAPTDIGLAATLYRACEKYNVQYIFEGHSFRTEGISPLGWIYMDGKYIESVQKEFGTRPLKTFPNMKFWDFMRWTVFKRIQKIRPLYYVDYIKKDAMAMLTQKYGWEYYGGHHLENQFTAFWHSFFLHQRWGLDTRLLGYSALVRSGQITREQGLELLSQPRTYDPDLIQMVQKRLGFSEEEFRTIMEMPKRTYREFRTYKPLFEKLRPLFYVLAKNNLAPMSFYIKYTSKNDV